MIWKATLLALTLAFAACGSDLENGKTTSTDQPVTTTTTPEATTTAVAETTTTESAEPTALRDVEGGTRSGIGWLAEPGLYVAYVDGRTLTLDMTEAFTFIPRRTDLIVAPADIGPGVRIISLALTAVEGVVPADQVGVVHDASDVSQITQPAPETLSDWLDSVSQMNTSSLTEVEGVGWVAMAWDIEVDSSVGETFSCPYGRCIQTLVPKGAESYVAGDEFGFRMWQFDGTGDGLYGFAQSPLADLDAADVFYSMVLSGLTIED